MLESTSQIKVASTLVGWYRVLFRRFSATVQHALLPTNLIASMSFNLKILTRSSAACRRPAGALQCKLVATLSVVLAACSPSGSSIDSAATPSAPGPDVLARFGDIEITVAELDARVVKLPPAERPPPGADLDAWFREQAREMVLDRHFLKLAREAEDDRTPAFSRARSRVQDQVEIELCLRDQSAQMPPPSKADLEAEFDQHREKFKKEERRLTHHIFRRTASSEAQYSAVAELDGLRLRVLNGEPFPQLARDQSDSESRHRNGELGWLSRGELPAKLDDVVFSLDEGVPSQPVTVQDGVHLFFVASINLARDGGIVEAMPVLRERLLARRMDELINRIVAEDPRDFSMPEKARFEILLKSEDANIRLLEDGNFVLTLSEFRRQLRAVAARPEVADNEPINISAAWTMLEALRNREKLRAVCERHQWIDRNSLEERMRTWAEVQLTSSRRSQVLLEQARQNESRLKQYYEQNLEQFGTPVQWDLKRLILPLDQNSTSAIAILEERTRAGSADLDLLQAELGGVVQILKGMHVDDLRRTSPHLPGLIAPLEIGQVSPPLRTKNYLEAYQVIARIDSQTEGYASIKEKVAKTFARHHAAELYDAYAEKLFASAPLEIFTAALAQIVDTKRPEHDVSAEELDRLLENM